jgi:hypothetical protein
MTIHELKTWSYYFCSVMNESKKFEVRKNDRNFKSLDVLHLREWDEVKEKYTGRSCLVKVDHILEGGQFGIESGYCVMSINLMN